MCVHFYTFKFITLIIITIFMVMIKRDVKCSLFVVTVFDFVIVDSTTLGGQKYWTTRSLSFSIQVFSVAFPQVYEIKHLVVQWT